jgi:O-antigen/teichoic acid export membrane protein
MIGLGARGAAIATLISTVISFILFRMFTYKYEKVFMNLRILKPVLISIVTGIIIYLILEIIPVYNIIVLFGYGVLGIALYFTLLFIVGGFRKEDRELFKNVFDPFAMIKYIKDEFTGKNN